MRDINNEKEIYLNSRFPIDEGNETIKNIDVGIIKPKSLYKYMNLKDDIDSKLKSINDGGIWMSNANELNDPFECILKIPENINCSIFNDLGKQIYSIKKEYEKFLDVIKKETYITAFSENNKSLLMWSHYADSHKGICVEYSFDDLKSCENTKLVLAPVIYKDLFISIGNPKRIEELYNRCIQAFTRKSNDWKYENEWRFIKLCEKEYRKGFIEKIIKPKCIYLGININNELSKKIEEYFDGTDVNIEYMMTREYRYSVDTFEGYMKPYKNIEKP